MNAARCRIPPRERRWGVARTDRSGSAAGPCGRAPQERRGRSCRLGAPCSAPNQGCAERQWGTAIFSLGSLALSRVLGSASFPPPLRGSAQPFISRHPGLAARATRRGRRRGRTTGSNDPILRSHGSCGFSGPRPADAAYGRIQSGFEPPHSRARAAQAGSSDFNARSAGNQSADISAHSCTL